MKNITIKAKVAGAIVALAAVTFLLTGVVIQSLERSRDDAEIVDLAGRQRMLSQAMGKSVLGYTVSKSAGSAITQQITDLDSYISSMRGIYTTAVIAPAGKAKVEIAMDEAHGDRFALPFPATFARMVNDRYNKSTSMQVDIIADDPINPAKGLADAIDREAFATLSADPKRIFEKVEERNGKLYLRFYSADTATVEACASCHAKTKGKPYQVGDMLGIRRFTLLYANNPALGRSRLNPSLEEYEGAHAVFTQTLNALKNGGEYPLDTQRSAYKYYPGTEDPRIREKISQTEQVLADFTAAVAQLGKGEANSEQFWIAREQVLQGSNQLMRLSNDMTLLFTDIAKQNQVHIRWAVLVMAGVILIALVGLFVLLSGAVFGPIRKVIGVANAIADGDLTQRVASTRNDEIGALSGALDAMAQQLHTLVGAIVENAANVAAASEQIAASSSQMANSAEAQAQQVTHVATAAEELDVTSSEMTRDTTEASNAAREAAEVARSGGQVVQESIGGMNTIAETVSATAKDVRELAEHSEQISGIVTLIADIAEQTNLLALNAAIESARAGEQGRGFAVVAEEVRTLAGRTTEATDQIAAMIRQIQKGMESVVRHMDTGTQEVEKGVLLGGRASDSLEQIVEVVNHLSSQIQQVAAATEEQSVVSKEIASNITAISGITQETQTSTRQIADASEDLARLGSNLQMLVQRFKL